LGGRQLAALFRCLAPFFNCANVSHGFRDVRYSDPFENFRSWDAPFSDAACFCSSGSLLPASGMRTRSASVHFLGNMLFELIFKVSAISSRIAVCARIDLLGFDSQFWLPILAIVASGTADTSEPMVCASSYPNHRPGECRIWKNTRLRYIGS